MSGKGIQCNWLVLLNWGRILIVIAVVALASTDKTLAQDDAKAQHRATVGSVGRIDELMLPGSLLRAKPLENRNLPVLVRIVESFPHGDSFRYNLTYMALEPGRFDLREYLERADGSDLGDLPEIAVDIVSVLEAGHVPPHQLSSSWPQVGSYRFWMILALIFWVVLLVVMIFWPKKKTATEIPVAPALTLADLLRPRLQAAASGQLDSRQLAELERWVVEFWRRRLGLMELLPKQALLQLRQHETAGPLLQQLERWLHSPHRDPKVSLAELLVPYQQLEVSDDMGAQFNQAVDQPTAVATGGA